MQSELTKGRLLRFLEASRRAFRVEWEFIEGGCSLLIPTSLPSKSSTSTTSLTRRSTADIPSSAAGTEEASFAVELCWAFDDWVLRARPILTEDTSSFYEERAKARWRITKGEEKCKFVQA